MNHAKNLAWKLNWYRHSELEGALLLGRVLRAANDAELICSLSRHCADEARHAWLWTKTIRDLDLPMVQIFRSYQSLYCRQGSFPASMVEVLALTHVFEHRVDQQFREELQDPSLPSAAARTFRVLLDDEQGHLDWVATWLEHQPNGREQIERYQAIDAEIYREIQPFLSNVWELPGLGREIPARCEGAELPSVALQ